LPISNDPAIPFLGIYLKECKSGYNKDTFIPMFSSALFTVAKLQKEPRCPHLMNYLENVVFIYRRILFIIKKNEVMLFADK
jgi:hypothetical protein